MILETTDYEIFNKHEANRRDETEGWEKRIKMLMDSINSKNLLRYRPIIVDKNMKILDGNHRLEAAKRLGLPVFYEMKEDAGHEEIRLLNQQTPWARNDWVYYYAKTGNENYVRLLDMAAKNNFKPEQLLAIMDVDPRSGSVGKMVKMGQFKFPEEEKLKKIYENIDRLKTFQNQLEKLIKKTQHPFYSRTTFINAFAVLMRNERLNFEVLLKKIPYNLDRIGPRATQKQYLVMLQRVYNWKNQNPIDVDSSLYDEFIS